MPDNHLAKNIRELRKANKYTQQFVSDQIHIARQTYSLYEAGRHMPDVKTLCSLAELYHISVDALLHTDNLASFIAEGNPGEHFALLPQNSAIRLTGADAKMLMDYKKLPLEVQKEIRDFVRFKKSYLRQNPDRSNG